MTRITALKSVLIFNYHQLILFPFIIVSRLFRKSSVCICLKRGSIIYWIKQWQLQAVILNIRSYKSILNLRMCLWCSVVGSFSVGRTMWYLNSTAKKDHCVTNYNCSGIAGFFVLGITCRTSDFAPQAQLVPAPSQGAMRKGLFFPE